MKKNYYLVQIGLTYSSPCFLPYSVGCIAAYLRQDNEITENYNIPDIVVMREKTEDIILRFKEPAFAAFSCCIWNMEYNKTLAKELKKRFPEVKIIFAGHQVPPGGEMLKQYDFVDYLMHNEGEESTAMFLKALKNGTDLSEVPNLSYRDGDNIVTTRDYVPCDISNYPSPYLSGVFDGILQEFPQIEFHATLETNRGCPYSCAYCEWCFSKKIRPFSMEKIKAEIEWIASHKIKYTYCADANFGILDRDVEIARYVVEQKKNMAIPMFLNPVMQKRAMIMFLKQGIY